MPCIPVIFRGKFRPLGHLMRSNMPELDAIRSLSNRRAVNCTVFLLLLPFVLLVLEAVPPILPSPEQDPVSTMEMTWPA
jgi:hypothetical protein